jgi:hypothetical protein
MLNDEDIIGKVKIAILIGIVVVAVMCCGCTEKYIVSLPSSDASPSEIVETFASWHGGGNFEACYEYLMSEEYRNSTDESTFKEKMSQCKPPFGHYEFVGVRSEKIEGDSASVEVVYVKKKDFPANLIDKLMDNKPKNKTKTINLVKEEDGWGLTNLHCELKRK